MWKWVKWASLVIGIIIILPILYLFQPWVFLPHKHIQMSLPFAVSEDKDISLIPMGEKIEHNESNGTPDGHPGLDFGFKKETDILAVADGIITSIEKDKEGRYNIEQQMGFFYRTRYTELNSKEPSLHFLTRVKKGQVIGQTGSSEDISHKFEKGAKNRQMHWDFASSSMAIDRLCPVNYFDAESKIRLENIWANVPAGDIFRKDYPDICNGVFKNKGE